jgi:peptidoglycan/LPS O-acetylase OafA/YrhL
MADASYWMYLMHLPLITALQVLMITWPMHWVIKLPLILGVTTAFLLVTYHFGVRATFLGAFLNGRRHRRAGA